MEGNGNKKRGSRHAYVRDFKPDESGNYTYSGRIFKSAIELAALRRGLLTAIAVFCPVLTLQLAAGFLPGTGMEGHILMLLPYALGMAAVVRIIWILVRILRHAGGQGNELNEGGRYESEEQSGTLREYVYEATVKKLPSYLVAVQVFAGTALVDAAVCMIRKTYGMRIVPAVIFLISQMVLFAAGAWALRKNPAGEWN